jgi:hypothetical protein
LGWAYTTLAVAFLGFREGLQMLRSDQREYWSSFWNWLDWIFVLLQAVINVLLVTRDAYSLVVYDDDDGYAPPAAPPPLRRMLKAKGGSDTGDTEDGLTHADLGPLVHMQSIVILSVCVRLIYYFRGNLHLGALIHTFIQIIIDVAPLLILVGVLVVAFGYSMMALIMHELNEDVHPEWHSAAAVLYLSINTGLYTAFDSEAFDYSRNLHLLLLYEVFMMVVQVAPPPPSRSHTPTGDCFHPSVAPPHGPRGCRHAPVQIVLLNMLIALMAESHHRVSANAQLVAQYERAKLVLEVEQRHGVKVREKTRRVRNLMQNAGHSSHALRKLLQKEQQLIEKACPRSPAGLEPTHACGRTLADAGCLPPPSRQTPTHLPRPRAAGGCTCCYPRSTCATSRTPRRRRGSVGSWCAPFSTMARPVARRWRRSRRRSSATTSGGAWCRWSASSWAACARASPTT